MLLATVDCVLRIGAVVDAARIARRSPRPRASVGVILLGLVGVLFISQGFALATRRFVLEAFKIPSGSMIPTLLLGDHVFVDKLRGGRRGDVVVFPFPEHPDQDSRMWFGGEGGGVPLKSVRGVPIVVWTSISDRGTEWSRAGLDLDGPPTLPASMASLQPGLEKCLGAGR